MNSANINLSNLVDVHRSRRPDEPALLTDARTWTYEDLAATVHSFAAYLATRGIGRGDRVSLLGLNSAEYVNALLAIFRVGAIAVPLNYRLQQDELDYLLTNSGSVAILADEEFVGIVDELAGGMPSLGTRVCLNGSGTAEWLAFDDAVRQHQGAKVSSAIVGPEDIQRIMYTSGTTSRPKGVVITHGMVLCNISSSTVELQLTAADRILVSSPLYHIAGLDAPGLGILFSGGAMVIMRKFDAAQALRMIHAHRVTGGIFVQAVLHALRDASREDLDLSSLRWMTFGAASGELYRDVRRQFPTTRLVQAYGITEGCSMVSCVPERLALEKYGTVGTAVSFAEFRIVDANGEEAPAGQEGEIVIRGAKVTPGYWGDAAGTETAWRSGWFHTGDVGVLDADGFLSIRDRLKDMIRSGGENVASSEIERVIYGHPGVYEVAVIGVPDPRWQEVPKAFIVLKPGHSMEAEELFAFCRAKLASFKTPKYVEFVGTLPRNASGKVLKRNLRELASAPPR
ncbi:acyl-CoA synthetase (AMP-forming)/AMP-acid ligase II [Arthrobacter ginsengisoli]|uniref:Acyl-CoA synthetase (AMP-forming)/AMP-acid ligase II n=1 Tax=Arthrobacter ginsengisoli TaxID=1356565 RepID=A0ABU1UI80_9MICC|nr:long-chain-fatty-acid--CoA ligase [Arthrobacter ginsengisoli]MDR7084835.1 acyl-CoA synthetase (AMP-forming)/AMP-acid ligase II [Arthrobacter ginsengisoli]